MNPINRTAVVIRPRQPFVDWLNSIPGEDSDTTLKDVSIEHVTFLIPDFDYTQDSLNYIKQVYPAIFEFELFGWYTDETLWPKKRTWKLFQDWFTIEINSVVVDLADGGIIKEEW